ncbi:class I tRNA ligase family protein, partial [bacterium]|nr:class I tRNA ligase family protein [bacterium]
NVHGFWNVKGSKMSKSIGNVTDPKTIIDAFGLDQFRYFILREMVFGLDANFTPENIVSRINSDLANDLGNLFSRVLSMNHRYFKGKVKGSDPDIEKEKNLSLKTDAKTAIDKFEKNMSVCAFSKGLESVWQFISTMNKYIDTTAPWALAKDEANIDELATILYNLIEGLRVVSSLIYPIMPHTSFKMQQTLCIEKENNGFYTFEEISLWNQIQPGTIIDKPEILFPRIDTKKN